MSISESNPTLTCIFVITISERVGVYMEFSLH